MDGVVTEIGEHSTWDSPEHLETDDEVELGRITIVWTIRKKIFP